LQNQSLGIDGRVFLSIVVECRIDPTVSSKDSPGLTLAEHERLHVTDSQRWCQTLDSKIKTEGFPSPGACEAARSWFMDDVLNSFNQTILDSRRDDGKK